MRIYEIYEEEKLIFTGTDGEVKKRFGCTSGMHWYSTQNHKIKGIYEVRAVEDSTPLNDPTWDCLHMMLVVRKEKKTSVAKDPHKYIKKLRECGVEVRVTPYMSYMIRDTDITAPPKSKRKPQKCWYVERV